MLIVILLVIGALVGIAIAGFYRRGNWQSQRPYPPERGPYGPEYGRPHGYGPGYDPYYRHPGYDGYGRPHHSGMNAGAAGAIGAVGGGLLGYELGKMEGEHEQFRHDEAMERREDYGPYDNPDQGGWMGAPDPGYDDGGWGFGDGGW